VSERVARSEIETGRQALVRAFYEAFNEQDLERFAATLHPEVELQTARGAREGRAEARAWATKDPGGGLEQTMVVEEVIPDAPGTHALALYRKQWHWREDARLAHSDEMAALFTFRDGMIARWQPFGDRQEALALFRRLGGASSNLPAQAGN
jgi:ketosteroid isomerase-like protein